MLAVGLFFFIWLAIKKNFEPMLLQGPIGFGILIGNIPSTLPPDSKWHL